jgi:putative peptidoglycan lipid II flippase
MSLARNFTIVGGATLASRITGFGRDVLVAAVLGTGQIADAYVAAFLLPNLFRRIVGEGAFNAAFVPIHARRAQEGGAAHAMRFSENALGLFLGVAAAIVLMAELFMPAIMGALAPGFREEPEKFATAVAFGRIAMPFVAVILVVAIFSGTLNALGRYALAAWAPVLLNILLMLSLAAAAVLGWHGRMEAGLLLVWTVLAAGLLQMLVVGVGLRLSGHVLRLRWPEWDSDLQRFLVVALPGLAIAGAGPLNTLVAAQASTDIPSAVSWLYYADRVFQLPLGFVAAAIGVVLLPAVARHVQAGDHAAAQEAESRACEFGLLLTLPAAAALAILAEPIVAVLFERGAFTAQDTAATAASLRALALGLPGFVLVKVLLPAFLAREKLLWPLLAAAAGLLANVLATRLLTAELGHVAPAAGVSVSAWVNALLLGAALTWRGQFRLDGLARFRLPRIVLAAALTGAAVLAVQQALGWLLLAPQPFAARAALLGLLCLAGVAVHVLLAQQLGALELRGLRGWLGRSRESGAPRD